MSQGQSPQTQIGGSVRDCTEYILNGMDGLMNENFTHWFIVVTVRTTLVTFGCGGQLGFTLIQFNVTGQFTIVLRL